MKTLKCFLSFATMVLLIGSLSSCSRDDDNGIIDPVDPPIEVVYKTFVVVMDEYVTGDYRLAIELKDEINKRFPTAIVTRQLSTVTVKMPEKEVDRFNDFMELISYVISFEELK